MTLTSFYLTNPSSQSHWTDIGVRLVCPLNTTFALRRMARINIDNSLERPRGTTVPLERWIGDVVIFL